MKFSKSTELAIHGLWMIAASRPKQMFVSEMAQLQNVSETYLAKVFQRLARRGLVHSIRGRRGGFILARHPEKISIAEIAKAVEAEEPLFDCLGLHRKCKGRNGCPLHDIFFRAEKTMLTILDDTSLADVMSVAQIETRLRWLGH